jgi:hypothetical protein
MIIIVIAFPDLVLNYKSGQVAMDPSKVEINIPMPDAGGANPYGAPATPSFGAPPAPSFGAPPAQNNDVGGGLPPPSFGAPAQ